MALLVWATAWLPLRAHWPKAGGWAVVQLLPRLAALARKNVSVKEAGTAVTLTTAEVLPLFLGGDLEMARPQHIRASPLFWVTPNAAPTLCIHGTEDKYVAHEQAVWLVDRLKAANVEAELLTLPGAGHGFKGKDAETAEKALVAFMAKYLKKK